MENVNEEKKDALEAVKENIENKMTLVLGNIKTIENSITEAIDNVIIEKQINVTTTEIISALLNVTKKFNKIEWMDLINK